MVTEARSVVEIANGCLLVGSVAGSDSVMWYLSAPVSAGQLQVRPTLVRCAHSSAAIVQVRLCSNLRGSGATLHTPSDRVRDCAACYPRPRW